MFRWVVGLGYQVLLRPLPDLKAEHAWLGSGRSHPSELQIKMMHQDRGARCPLLQRGVSACLPRPPLGVRLLPALESRPPALPIWRLQMLWLGSGSRRTHWLVGSPL